MIKDINLSLLPQDASSPDKIKKFLSEHYNIPLAEINDLKILKRSIDARKKNIKVNLSVRLAIKPDKKVNIPYKTINFFKISDKALPIIIVGAGPAGLFAGLKAIELGYKPIIIERGSDVDSRRLELAKISREEKLNPETNYCFGEGGAGAFSDGKLFTRSKKRGNIHAILELLHQFGAKEDILIDSHPHIGSDKLPTIIKNIREKIKECGGEIRFNELMKDLIIEKGKAVGIITSKNEELHGPVILATGHSARDIYRLLERRGVNLESKGFAMGVRLEHPQVLIDKLQYHSPYGRGDNLPAAEYSFVTQVNNRGVYSFCMCPGGVIVPSMSGEKQSVVNGMSASQRNSKWANSGMVVEIRPEDINNIIPSKDKKENALDLMLLQEELEEKFYKAAEGTFKAPSQRMEDFVNGIESTTLPQSSYAPGLISKRVDEILPDFISKRLKTGFKEFGKKCKGFLTNEACVIGLESRTSSPVRIPRNKETLEHIEIEDLYPAGEGAGYAGGIVSAAIDGQKCVESYHHKILESGCNY